MSVHKVNCIMCGVRYVRYWYVAVTLWLSVVAEYQGIYFQTGSTMTTKKGVVVSVDETRACRIAFLMSPGSHSGFAVHEPVRR
jgi:hypothetical protein